MEERGPFRRAPDVTYEIRIDGRSRSVDVERTADGFRVTIDGRRHAVDVTVINGVWSLILAAAEGDARRRSYEIAMVEQPPGSGNLSVHVDGRVVHAGVAPTGPTRRRRGHDDVPTGSTDDAARQQVTAPMPGKVIRVLVRPGDVVSARQGVVVVEAMKMENELRTTRGGRVAELRVAEGASVDAGAILVVIE